MIKKCTVLITVLFRFLHNTGAAEAIENWVRKLKHTAPKKQVHKTLIFFTSARNISWANAILQKISLYEYTIL